MKKFLPFIIAGIFIMALTGCGAAKKAGNGSTEGKTEGNAGGEQNQGSDKGKVLVAYFSCTGNTKGIAEIIAEGTGADIYEIVPVDPYTDEDLDYNDNDSRSTIEMNDDSARPAISGKVENMEQYDTIYIGYPKLEQGFARV